jgi:hypothetical protein
MGASVECTKVGGGGGGGGGCGGGIAGILRCRDTDISVAVSGLRSPPPPPPSTPPPPRIVA